MKIGYVNYSQLMQESPQAKAIAAKLRSEFQPRQTELAKLQQDLKTRADKFQRDAATMTDEQREKMQNDLQDSDRDLQRRQSELQDDFTQRRNEELSSLQRILVEQVRTYAKAQSFDLVLADGVIYWTQALDITPAILTRLQQAAGAPATAPRKARSSR